MRFRTRIDDNKSQADIALVAPLVLWVSMGGVSLNMRSKKKVHYHEHLYFLNLVIIFKDPFKASGLATRAVIAS